MFHRSCSRDVEERASGLRNRAVLFVAFALWIASPLHSQGTATLVRDVNPTLRSWGALRLGPVVAGPAGRSYFLVEYVERSSLWSTDGTETGTAELYEFDQQTGSHAGPIFGDYPGGVFFEEVKGVRTYLMFTDGTRAGTRIVHAFDQPYPGTNPEVRFLGTLPSGILFSVWHPQTGRELWFSDGISANLVRDIHPSHSDPSRTTLLGSVAYFAATDVAHGRELWRTDGTSSGTWLFADISPGTASSSPGDFSTRFTNASAPFNVDVVFAATHPSHGRELWSTDGTSTNLLADIQPGAVGSNPVPFPGSDRRRLQSGRWTWSMLCAATTVNEGRELWRISGSSAALVTDISPGLGGSTPQWLGSVSAGGLFHAAGALRVTDNYVILPVQNAPTGINFDPRWTALDGSFRFLAGTRSGVNGLHVWSTDGSIVTDHGSIVATTVNALGISRVAAGGVMFLRDAGAGPDIWRADWTGQASSFFPRTEDAWFESMKGWNDALYMNLWDGSSLGYELWKSDGSPSGTRILADIAVGNSSSPSDFTPYRGKLLFAAWDSYEGRQVYYTDGTPQGTGRACYQMCGTDTAQPEGLTPYRGGIHMAAGRPNGPPHEFGHELRRAVGQPPGSWSDRLVSNINPTGDSNPAELTVMGDALFFTAMDTYVVYPTPILNRELWITDGTSSGTHVVAELRAGNVGSDPRDLTVVSTHSGDRLFFSATDGRPGRGLWSTDGTSRGTRNEWQVFDLQSSPEDLTVVDSELFFTDYQPTLGRELYRAGSCGACLVRDIAPLAESSDPQDLTPFRGGLLFTAWTPNLGRELYFCDPLNFTVVLVRDVRAGHQDGVLPGTVYALEGANRALFVGSDGTTGWELWVTDGTSGGTQLHQRLAPTWSAGSHPARFTRAGSCIFFTANDGLHGEELWVMDSMAAAEPYGVGCAAPGRSPARLRSSGGAPVLGNASFGVRLTGAPPSTDAGMLLALGSDDLYLGTQTSGCSILVDGHQLVVFSPPMTTDPNGALHLPLPIPSDVSFLGNELFCQFVMIDPLGPLPPLSFSDGLSVLIAAN